MTLIQGSQPSLENPAENKHPGLTLFPNSLNKVNQKAPGKKADQILHLDQPPEAENKVVESREGKRNSI